jgi:hypothetical protein
MRWSLQLSSFLLSKDGAGAAECEDAVALNEAARRFALADGATEAFDARGWAQRLVASWTARERDSLLDAADCAVWLADEGARFDESWAHRELSWYGAEKLQAGSFAAFVGAQFEERKNELRYRAIALGDSCLVRCRAGKIVHSFPLGDAAQFTSAPYLAPSRARAFNLSVIAERTQTESGAIQTDEIVYLLSDAIAAWFLAQNANGTDAVAKLDALLRTASPDEIARFLQNEKASGDLKDDDIAILRIAFRQS